MPFEPRDIGICPAILLPDPMRCDRRAFEALMPAGFHPRLPGRSPWALPPPDGGGATPARAPAWRTGEGAGQAKGGILLDLWHWHRQPGGPAFELLSRIPGERIHYVQVCDATDSPQPDVFAGAMSARVLPGDGVVD